MGNETPIDVSADIPIAQAIQEPPKGISRKRVEAIASATLGLYRHLVHTTGGYRWSEYSEHDDNPNHDDYEAGCAVFATPLDALKGVLEACDFLVDPETNEPMLMVLR